MNTSVPVAILGPTGYTGLELLELLASHPRMHAAYLASARPEPIDITREFPRLCDRLDSTTPALTKPIDHNAIARDCKLAFLCLPHDAAMAHTPPLLQRGVKVVDLSAAYRIKDPATYHSAYAHHHTDLNNLAHAVYGLPELNRAAIRSATLVANPGCYPTAAALALAPFVRAGLIEPGTIVINAASGVSGAGREPKPNTTLVEAGDNFSTYALGTHRHEPEIEQTLANITPAGGGKPGVLFLPHLLPIERGILETITATPSAAAATMDQHALTNVLTEAYRSEPFVVVRSEAPTLRDVQRTNRVHLCVKLLPAKGARPARLVIVAAIDNLTKGASGQALQNANIVLGLDEHLGLR